MVQHLFRAPAKAFPDPAPRFTNANRPDPSTVQEGTEIFNLDDNAPNWADGQGHWRDALGNIT